MRLSSGCARSDLCGFGGLKTHSQRGSANHKRRTVLARNPLRRLAPARPGGTGVGIPVLGSDLLGLGLPGEDLLGGEAELLNELQNGLEGLFGLGLLGVGDLFVEKLFLGKEFGVAGHAGMRERSRC